MKNLLLIIGLLLVGKGYSQSKIDSLEQNLSTEKVDSLKVNTLLDLTDEYRYEDPKKAEKSVIHALKIASGINEKKYEAQALISYADLLSDRSSYDSAITFFQKALLKSESINFADGKSAALIGLGNAHTRKGNLNKGEEYLRQNITFATETEDFEGVASSYNNLGNIFNEQGEYTKAMEAYTEAAKMNTQTGNEKFIGINMANIGMIHQKLENFDEALSYYKQSDSLFKKLDFPLGQAFVMKNMGIVHRNQGKPEEALNQYRKALESYGQMGRKHEMSQTYQNIGNIYSDNKQSGKAIENYRRSLLIATEINDSIDMAMSNQSLGQEFLYANNLDSSTFYSNKAIEIARAVGANLTEMDGYKTLSEANYAKGNYKSAYDFRIKYEAQRDSLYNLEKRDLAEEIEAKYQNEQKTEEIAQLASEKALQALQLGKRKSERNAIIAFAVLILLLAGLFYSQYRIKQKANQEMQKLNQLKSNFFANITHEFRTPLTLIIGPLEQKLSGILPDEERQTTERMLRHAQRLLRLINQLLDFAKLEQQPLQLSVQPGNLTHFLQSLFASFEWQANQQQIDYQVHWPSQEIKGYFDADKLDKIIYNLLSNAFKFTPSQGEVFVTVTERGKQLEVQVKNSGQGIAPDQLPHIFERFYQAKQTENSLLGGTGIGLALTKELGTIHRGTITVESVPDQETVFTVSIPIDKADYKQTEGSLQDVSFPDFEPTYQPKPEKSRVEPENDFDLPKLLLVEDHQDLRTYLREQTASAYRMVEAVDGVEGWEAALAHSPDLIICDWMMPRLDGRTLCKRLKADVRTSHIPVIMLTARADQASRLAGLETGADAYLVKPFNPEELRLRIRKLVEQRMQLQSHFQQELIVSPQEIKVNSTDERFLQQAVAVIESQLANTNYSVAEWQQELNLSRMHLHRKLKALTGQSATEFIRTYRLKRAAQLLVQRADNVSQVAYQVGFGSLSYFTSSFKAQFGCTPSEYAEKTE